ncbi:MAG: lysophospholipid acyltransferase family protein [Muribaculaceae bacterium]|nr:lysophospholipid acyltransferase family protein [Muribaculaceae bacterium]
MNSDQDNLIVRPDVLNYDDIRQMIPKLDGHEKFVNWLLHFLSVDKVNQVHRNCCDTPGPEFVRRLLFDEFKITLRVDNEQVLDHLPQGAFITVSNHPFGALDGITLIHRVASRRPQFKVLVNMMLNKISAMRPNFIAVDALASDDPAKRAVSVNGIRQALRQLKDGQPVGFFPAGAMSKSTLRHGLQDRQWQKSVLQIISKAKVPVIPIFFHGRNSHWCNFLGHVCWPARSLRLPAEVFRKVGTELHVSVGDPISPEEQARHNASPEQLGEFLRQKTYQLSKLK